MLGLCAVGANPEPSEEVVLVCLCVRTKGSQMMGQVGDSRMRTGWDGEEG